MPIGYKKFISDESQRLPLAGRAFVYASYRVWKLKKKLHFAGTWPFLRKFMAIQGYLWL